MSQTTLIHALLDDGMRSFSKLMTPVERREYALSVQEDAGEWLFSDNTEPGSFLWCCTQLGLDHEELIAEAIQQRAENDDKVRVKRS